MRITLKQIIPELLCVVIAIILISSLIWITFNKTTENRGQIPVVSLFPMPAPPPPTNSLSVTPSPPS